MKFSHAMIDYLDRSSFWEAFKQKLDEIREGADVVARLHDIAFDDADAVTRLDCDRNVAFAANRLGWFETLVKEYVLPEFAPPFPLTIEDLNSMATTHLAGVRTSELEAAKDRFVCCSELLLEEGDGFDRGFDQIDLGFWKPLDIGTTDQTPEYLELWGDDQGIRVYLNADLVPQPNSLNAVQAHADCIGHMSRNAAGIILEQLRSVFPTFCDTMRALSLDVLDDYEIDLFRFAPLDSLITSESKNVFAAFVGWGSRAGGSLSKREKRTNFELRIANAIEFLKTAGHQARPRIGAALYFSAIESLVCGERDGVVQQISQHVASLLQPDPLSRGVAIKAIKKLYDYRCRVIHGEPVDDDHKQLAITQRLASAVLSAAIEWRKFRDERNADASTLDDFVGDLRRCWETNGRIEGVPASYQRYLPPVSV